MKLTPERIAELRSLHREILVGHRKPGGITYFLTRGKKRIRKNWTSVTGNITETWIDKEGHKVKLLAEYPGECYWSLVKKAWKIRRKT